MSIGTTPCPGCKGLKHRESKRCLKCHLEALSTRKYQEQPTPSGATRHQKPQQHSSTTQQEILKSTAQVKDKLLNRSQSAMKQSNEPSLKQASVSTDREHRRLSLELQSVKARYRDSLKLIDHQQDQIRTLNALDQGVDAYAIKPKKGKGTSEATAVMVASDWHIEEKVGAEVGGLNKYNLDIAAKRAATFFQSGLRLVRLLQQDVQIPTIVLALLGDFISNDIHEEFTDVNQLQPIHALVAAQNHIISGIQFLLEHFTGQLVVPCHSGNHARTTRTTRFAAENGHSLEYLMYLHLAAYFRDEPRITFIVPEGMHSYVKIYDTVVRFQHGHAIKYGGGVGGIFIPANKAIAQWSRARHADLDVFGHFHQLVDGGNFICNGSLIGYSAFALSIKASFEKPRQALFLIDKTRGRTCTWPILVDK